MRLANRVDIGFTTKYTGDYSLRSAVLSEEFSGLYMTFIHLCMTSERQRDR